MDSMDQDLRGRDLRERQTGRRGRAPADPLDQRVDRWVTAGRQFVEGVSGSRPGGRRPAPRGEGRPPRRPRLDDLGRWVEDRLDWLLDDGDDWREPWQDADRAAAPSPPPSRSRRQGLEAISRRGPAPVPQVPPSPVPVQERPTDPDPGEWPDDASFTLPRWQRPERPEPPDAAALRPSDPTGGPGSRPLPRSSRRRP